MFLSITEGTGPKEAQERPLPVQLSTQDPIPESIPWMYSNSHTSQETKVPKQMVLQVNWILTKEYQEVVQRPWHFWF